MSVPAGAASVGDLMTSGLPVTVPGDVVLVRRPGLCVGVGPVYVYRDGFVFHLVSCTAGSVSKLVFHGRTEEERRNRTQLVVRYADGRMADSTQAPAPHPPHGLLLLAGSDFADRAGGWHREQTMWLVTPLPTAGAVSFEIYLPGEAAMSGGASLDSSRIVSAAARAQVLWPPAKPT